MNRDNFRYRPLLRDSFLGINSLNDKKIIGQVNNNNKRDHQKDGKNYKSDASGVEGILRIIQSIPSKSAEPFKRWLAKTGFERIKERENPHLAIKRAMLDYELQGRSKKWICIHCFFSCLYQYILKMRLYYYEVCIK